MDLSMSNKYQKIVLQNNTLKKMQALSAQLGRSMDDNNNINDLVPNAPQGELVLFQSGDGQVQVECRFEADTLWLTQKMIADLY